MNRPVSKTLITSLLLSAAVCFLSLLSCFATEKVLTDKSVIQIETQDMVNSNSEIIVGSNDIPTWIANIQHKIKTNWTPQKSNKKYRTIVRLTLSREGKLVDVNIKSSTATEVQGLEVIEAVRKSSPFQPFPASIKEATMSIEYTFDYETYGKEKPFVIPSEYSDSDIKSRKQMAKEARRKQAELKGSPTGQ